MKLYRPLDLPGHLVGEDKAGKLMLFPATPRGWSQRTAYDGPRRGLPDADREESRGTGWPGSPRGPAPRGMSSGRDIKVRVTDAERADFEKEAGDRHVSTWLRELGLAEVARRKRRA